MAKSLTLLFLLLLCTSCIQISGLTSDYKKLDPAAHSHISTYEVGKDTLPNHFYTITGEQIRQQFEQQDKVLVYLFTSGCSGPTCYPLATFKRWADENGYKIYFVTTSYYNLGATYVQQVNIPLYIINHKAYDTNMYRKYYKRFRLDLLQNEEDAQALEKGDYASLFVFEKGKLTQHANDLLQLEPKFLQQ